MRQALSDTDQPGIVCPKCGTVVAGGRFPFEWIACGDCRGRETRPMARRRCLSHRAVSWLRERWPDLAIVALYVLAVVVGILLGARVR